MSINFPSSPSIGQIVTSGGMSYIWDGTKWKSLGVDVLARSQNLADLQNPEVARTNLKIPSVYLKASRGVGQETIPVGYWPILGSFAINRGGWGIGASNGIVVPISGVYKITNRVYINGNCAGARVGVSVNSAGGGLGFVHVFSAGAGTLEGTEIAALTAGQLLQYSVTQATIIMYTAAQHSEVMIELLEAY